MSDTGRLPYGGAQTTTPGSPSADALRAQIERQRADLGHDLDVLGDKVSPGRMVDRRRAAMRQSARGLKERIMGAADTTTSRIGDTAGGATGTMGDAVGAVGERIGHVPDAARQATEGNPLAVGLVAFGAGAVLASLFPTSERERRMAHGAAPALERAAEEAGAAARHAADELKPMAEDAAGAVKEHAQDAVEQLKDEAHGVAAETKSAARSAAQDVRSTY